MRKRLWTPLLLIACAASAPVDAGLISVFLGPGTSNQSTIVISGVGGGAFDLRVEGFKEATPSNITRNNNGNGWGVFHDPDGHALGAEVDIAESLVFTVENLTGSSLSLRTIIFNNFGNNDQARVNIDGNETVVSGSLVSGPFDPYDVGSVPLFEGFSFSVTGENETNGFFVHTLVFVPEPATFVLFALALGLTIPLRHRQRGVSYTA